MNLKRASKLSIVAGALLLASAILPTAVHAANTCNGFIALGYSSTQTFSNVGDTLMVTLTIGTGSITGGTKATLNRVRFELDCDAGSPLGLGCADDGAIISYLGDSSISTDCVDGFNGTARTFSTGHAAGTAPNQLVFTPSTPFDIRPGNPSFCNITFGIRVAALSDDITPRKAEEVAGYSAATTDLRCDNNLSSAGSQSGSIALCPNCNDNNACTQDTCNPDTGVCSNTDTKTPTCNDNNACTTDTCNPATGACVNTDTKTPTCNDNNACTTDTCNPATGACVNTDTKTPTCNDNNACTTDTCNPATGACVNTDTKTPTCNDNNACTTDTCNPATGACVNTDTKTPTCNDNNACTTDSCDPATGACRNLQKDCNDNNICTDDTCDPTSGQCRNTFDASNDPTCTCQLTVNKQGCVVQPPPPSGGACTGGAVALTVQYTGPAMPGAATVVVTSSNASATYTLPDLNPGDILTSAAEHGFTIDATAHGQTKLGSTTSIRINGVLEVLHTSCSCKATPETNLMVCNPMCLDASSPDNSTGSKGPPSPLWTLVAEVDPSLGTQTCDATPPSGGTCVTEIPATPPPPHCIGKLQALQLRYAGGGCAASSNTQAAGKVICTGTAGTTQPVRILITSKKNTTTVYANKSNVALGDIITAAAASGGTFDTDTVAKIFSGSTLLETIQFHTSCSQPLNLGDHFGSLEVVGIDTTGGNPITMGADVEYTYKITNNGAAPVSNVTVVDNVLGTIPGSPITSIAANGMVTLKTTAFVKQATTNTVTVTGNNGQCQAMASATVLAQPPLCVLGYPFASSDPRTSVVFNESEVLRAFQPTIVRAGQTLQVFYNDEHALTLGVRRVIVKSSSGTTTTDYPVTPLTTNPGGAINPQVGAPSQNGDQAGTDTSVCAGAPDLCDRPMFPALFLTDVTNMPNSKAGDWQFGGTPVPPHAVFGTWKAAVRTVDKTKSPAVVTVTPDADPAKNNYALDGGDPAPAGLVNQGYGAEVRWNVDQLGLTPGNTYRVQFMVHDGDQNKTGGDTGQGCATVLLAQ